MWQVFPVTGTQDFTVSEEGGNRSFLSTNREDADWLCTVLDEATNTTVKLYCQTAGCAGKGGFITRSAADAKKNVFACDECGKAMVRQTTTTPALPKPAPAVHPAAPSNMVLHPPRIPEATAQPATSPASDMERRFSGIENSVSLLTKLVSDIALRVADMTRGPEVRDAEDPQAPTTLPG